MAILEPMIKGHFRPEFINRLDDILPFLPLKRDDMQKIVEIQLKYLIRRLEDRQVSLKWTKEVVDYLAEKGYDPFFGARPLKRLIQQDVVNLLSTAILEGKIPAESTVELHYDKEKITFKVKAGREGEKEKGKEKKKRREEALNSTDK